MAPREALREALLEVPLERYSSPMHAGGRTDLVVLDKDHPGFKDPVYRARRNAIARIAQEYKDGDPVPMVPYSDEEHAVWREVWRHLAPLHERYACDAYKEGARLLALPHDHIPQVSDIDRALEASVGFRFFPVAGLVTARTFLTYLANRIFLSTQYVRHASRPLYTPEPDVIHEIVGHAATFPHRAFVELNLIYGEAMARAKDEQAAEEIARAYWYTLEFGVVTEGGRERVYGAGLLSSFGELERFMTHAELLPLDFDVVAKTPYDPTDYQRVLFVAPSLDALPTLLREWLARHGR